MAKYTKCDDEINGLTEHDRVNYNFFMLNYNVDKQQQVAEGMNALRDAKEPMNLIEFFKNPKKLGALLISIVLLVLIITLVVYIFVYLLCKYIRKNEKEVELLVSGMPIVMGCFFIVVFIGLMYGVILKESMKAYMMIPQNLGTKKNNNDSSNNNTNDSFTC
jgi:hypothetical protein